MASPVALASACPLLPAVADSYDKHTSTAAGSTTPGCGHTRTNAKVQIAPYQALPVAGPVITHHRAAALDVVEPAADMPEEASVRGGVPPSARRASPSSMGNAPAATSSPPPPSHHVQERLACIHETLQKYMKKLAERTSHHMGYPYNLDFDFGSLEGLNRFSINNLGDPFIESNYGVHSREFEVGVLNWFARLWEISEQEYWGYITNCGTEGNLHGILVGRENLPDGILYASRETHYSVFKAARMYRMDAEKVDTLPSGEIDYDDLKARLAANVSRPAIINVNIGTTVKGAVDDLDRVLDILAETGYPEERFYIHCDGALFGMMMPFIKQAPMVTFRKPIGSVSVSGHKFVGAPVPCGVVITRTRYVMALSSDVEYLNSRDATIMGSRNGHAPIYLWYTLTLKGYEGIRADVERCMRNAALLKAMLQHAGVRAMLNDLSNTVVFERPAEEAFVRKWQLACEGDIAHVVVMPNIDIDKLEEFVTDLVNSRARGAIAAARRVAGVARAAEASDGGSEGDCC